MSKDDQHSKHTGDVEPEIDWIYRESTQEDVDAGLLVACAVSILLELFVLDRKGSFGFDEIFGFYAFLGFVSCTVMILLAKALGFFLKKPTNFYTGRRTPNDLPPGLVLILGALFVPLLPGKAKSLYVIALPVIAFIFVALLPSGTHWNASWLAGFGDVSLLRVDKLAKAFGYIFTLNATAAFIYAFYVKDNTQHVSALLYIGSALGAVFAGDLITLYVFWEIMAVASTLLILARRTSWPSAPASATSSIHILGGLFLLAGIVITFNKTGSIAFERFDPDTMKHSAAG